MFLVGSLLRFGFVTAWIFHLVACMGGCLGSDAKNKLIKSRESQTGHASQPCMIEGVGKISMCEMDDNAACISSSSTPSPTLDSQATGNTSQEFINHGFLLWNQVRQQWVGNKRKSKQTDQNHEPRLSRNATYGSLLGSNKPFTEPVPLPEMIDFLVDVWEQEGLYD
ncbi:hypothetical protein SSX86_010186 [Deinandra increscens subsp. villosa]|uniref:Gag1-like clamp domain-containing protein n=1 Tax=Deinandra increscens subsp. villosa TaxID=3103831 RepID=A0AAP0D730_9ASTR